jgi:hypothetical protein
VTDVAARSPSHPIHELLKEHFVYKPYQNFSVVSILYAIRHAMCLMIQRQRSILVVPVFEGVIRQLQKNPSKS